MNVLFVCDGNVCRSPVAELLFAARLPADSALRVSSAGLCARPGERIDRGSAAVLARHSVDSSAFRSTPLYADVLARAGVVITMTRVQRDAVLRAWPAALPRTVTLRELTRRIGDDTPRPSTVEGTVASLRDLVRDAVLARGPYPPPDDDIADPVRRRGPERNRLLGAVASEVDSLTGYLRCGSPPAVSACPPGPPR